MDKQAKGREQSPQAVVLQGAVLPGCANACVCRGPHPRAMQSAVSCLESSTVRRWRRHRPLRPCFSVRLPLPAHICLPNSAPASACHQGLVSASQPRPLTCHIWGPARCGGSRGRSSTASASQ